MSAWEIVFLALSACGFLGFIAAIGGVQWHLSRTQQDRGQTLPTRKGLDAVR